MCRTYQILLLCVSFSLPIQAATVGNITAQTSRMTPQTLQRHFSLKSGDEFSAQRYEQAQNELHRLRVFKELDFTTFPRQDQVDIHIRARDGYYIFPIGFITGGDKSAAGASVAVGNLFKQAETLLLFGGGSKEGWTGSLGLILPRHRLNLSYTHLDANQRFYEDGWFNIPSVFGTADDKKDHPSHLLREVPGQQEQLTLTYKYRLTHQLYVVGKPQYKEVSYHDPQLDSGRHPQLTVGLEWADDIRPGMNMGALAGYGLTDKQKSLQDLPRMRHGYAGDLMYTAGGWWSGSKYAISKLAVSGSWFVELKTRHMLMLQLQAQEAFEASFSDRVTSLDVLNGIGRYDRQRRGRRGVGASAAFVYYLLRDQTGLLSMTPFYELAYVGERSSYHPHSGAGAALMYKFWRFPLPMGLNYTRNLQDGSDQIGFVIGGMF